MLRDILTCTDIVNLITDEDLRALPKGQRDIPLFLDLSCDRTPLADLIREHLRNPATTDDTIAHVTNA